MENIITEKHFVKVDDLGKDRSLIHEAVMAGSKVGAGRDFWTKLARDKDLFRDVVKLVMEKTESPTIEPSAVIYESTPSQIRARKIMGKNFLGIEEVVKHYKIVPTVEDLSALAEVSFSENTLEECKHEYLLVAGFPITILGVRTKVFGRKPKIFYSNEEDSSWYNIYDFANKEKVGLRWYLIRKTAVKDSFSKEFKNQIGLLGLNEEVPRACEFAYAVILYFLATGDRLFDDVYVRCIDFKLDNARISVGNFTPGGIQFNSYYGDYPYDYVGLASLRKS